MNRIQWLSALLFLIPTLAMASPMVSLEIEAEKQITRVTEAGEKETVYVPADNVAPGDEVRYRITYTNSGDSAARNVNVDNPIPEGTRYQSDSAWGGAERLFSIDNGATYKRPSSLTWQRRNNQGEQQQETASPEQYNAVRWVVEEIPAGTSGDVGFSVIVQ